MSADSSRLTPGLDLADINDRRVLAIGRVPANSRVLEIGLINSSVARALGKWDVGYGVSGSIQDAGEKARGCVRKVIEADLNSLDIIELVGDQRFDIILMLDVLEHLVNPATLLQGLANVVADEGWGVVSLPNAAHASLRLDFLQGRFSYPDSGARPVGGS